MIQDYEIFRNEEQQTKRSPWIELILSLLLIQTLLFLLPVISGAAEAVPADAIQIRIVANSNTSEDQQIKSLIQQEIQPLLEKAAASVQTTAQLEKELNALSTEITLKAQAITKQAIQISLAKALIPPKTDGTYFYAQDFHQSLVVTIGSGKGDNWWCALFPKVCYQEEEEEVIEEEPVKFWTWEWIKSKFW
ncbi:stage II sporulation protein R [Paenisporosarcina sp. HGH0030]|uniref:stage II sporulation protein R n=1 Tax=Paenisporosarcina sp. HGH0030 TaxID=1078085 RepID=UPI00034EBC52|nr:stage II sporulation protein R [Paenisporosarcina sp. HGH0030]EPD51648.1 stage II sporulation protein R [Paenisporosarcina sp. HGH0030]